MCTLNQLLTIAKCTKNFMRMVTKSSQLLVLSQVKLVLNFSQAKHARIGMYEAICKESRFTYWSCTKDSLNVQFYTQCAVLTTLCTVLEREICACIYWKPFSLKHSITYKCLFPITWQETCIISVAARITRNSKFPFKTLYYVPMPKARELCVMNI